MKKPKKPKRSASLKTLMNYAEKLMLCLIITNPKQAWKLL